MIQILLERLRAEPTALRAGIVVTYDIAGEGGGAWTFDLTGTPRLRKGVHPRADATVGMRVSDFLDMVSGRRGGESLFLDGRMQIKGDMGASTLMGSLIGTEEVVIPPPSKKGKTGAKD